MSGIGSLRFLVETEEESIGSWCDDDGGSWGNRMSRNVFGEHIHEVLMVVGQCNCHNRCIDSTECWKRGE